MTLDGKDGKKLTMREKRLLYEKQQLLEQEAKREQKVKKNQTALFEEVKRRLDKPDME